MSVGPQPEVEDFSSKGKSMSKGTEAEFTLVDPEDSEQMR